MKNITDFLTKGEENAVTSRYLCQILNMRPRELTAAIERERRSGKPICASTGEKPGYYLAKDRIEMERYCMALAHRGAEIEKTLEGCLKSLDNLPFKANK